MAAMGRALHRDGPGPHVLDDWMAADLAGEEGRAILDEMRANVTPDRLNAFVSLFHRDEIERLLVGHGFDAVTDFGAEDAVRSYFGGGDAGMTDVQRLATAAVAER